MTKKALSKKQKKQLAPMMTLGKGLGIKPVFLADTGDGAFSDHSVKVKPHNSGEGLVLKCTNLQRLRKALLQAGFNPSTVKVIKGRKHFIAFLGDVEMGPALQSGGKKLLKKG